MVCLGNLLFTNRNPYHYHFYYIIKKPNAWVHLSYSFVNAYVSSSLFLEPVRPTILGPIQVHDDPDDENAVVLRVEYDAVPEPEVTWMKDDQPLNDLSGIEVRFIFEDSLFISIIKDF